MIKATLVVVNVVNKMFEIFKLHFLNVFGLNWKWIPSSLELMKFRGISVGFK